MPRFMIVGDTFIMGAYWGANRGPVVASAHGIHVVVERGAVQDAQRLGAAPEVPVMALGPGGWLWGKLAGVMAGKQVVKSDKVLPPLSLNELPAVIAGDPEWPVKQKKGFYYFVPRDEVEAVKVSWVGNMYVWFKGMKYTIEVGTFSAGKVRRFLGDCGWPV